MVAHALSWHLAKRQLRDPVAAPTGVAGITGDALTVGTEAATATNLAFDASATGADDASAPPLDITGFNNPPPAPTNNLEPEPSAAVEAQSNSSKPIAMSTVIASCVGAFIGAVALILLGLWFYRRYSQSLKAKARPRRLGPADHANARGEAERSRSRMENWDKLEDGDDKWEGQYQTREVDNIAPMEKLTMFKKSTPSVRTAYTHAEEPVTFDLEPHPFAQYHPNLAQELSSDSPSPRPFLGRVDTGPALSWDRESGSVGDPSFLSIRSGLRETGAMSPTLNMAIPTPPATSHKHHWESAEVVHYNEGQSTIDPFSHADERRKSSNNPFFSAQDSNTRSRSNSEAHSTPRKSNKGKERAIDPFTDDHTTPPPPMIFTQHSNSMSTSSIGSNDRAIQSLIAALDVSEDEVQARLRVASMQPSFVSGTSVYTDADEEDVTRDFPLPPSVDGSHATHIGKS